MIRTTLPGFADRHIGYSVIGGKMAQPDGVEPPSSDLESEALATNTKAVLKKMSEKDSNLHEVASSSSCGLIGVEPKRH